MTQIDIQQYKGHRFMYLDDYLWMWDTPQERDLQNELADQTYGEVLVAGYGFGLLTERLLKNPDVRSVTTVEKYPEVIEKMRELSGQIYGDVIIKDFFDLNENKKYDCIIGDIWPDIAAKFLKDYLEFKHKAEKLLKDGGSILAWGKEFFDFLDRKKQLGS